MKKYKGRASWDDLVWDLPRLAGAGLPSQQVGAEHFTHKPVASHLEPRRGHLQERETPTTGPVNVIVIHGEVITAVSCELSFPA